jgi:NAD(P)-dependent dehydrogenase (short-subunit alcohol dehydrogenase family)
MAKEKRPIRPSQRQARQPGKTAPMRPHGKAEGLEYVGCGLLRDQVALITGADSGIGRAVAVAFAKEGAQIAFSYLDEHDDAAETTALVERAGVGCLAMPGDLARTATLERLVSRTIARFGRIDVLVNNSAVQFPADKPEEMEWEHVELTFRINILAAMRLTSLVLPHLKRGSSIICTSSVVAYRGSNHLVDYAATKAALLGYTRSLALALADRGIRVNAVAPGPIWTPLIPATFRPEEVATFGSTTPMGRAGEPDEVAPAYVLLASERGSYITGQCIHVNGGEVVNA